MKMFLVAILLAGVAWGSYQYYRRLETTHLGNGVICQGQQVVLKVPLQGR